MSEPVEFPASSREPIASVAVRAKVRRYRAFISYSHADTRWANWLMRKLEGYRVPARFHGRVAPVGEVGARLAPVFRDRDELPTTSDLGETIRAALRESATLIVICSPSSAQSRWVQEEIVAFKRMHGEREVFAFIVAGEPKFEGTADDCFSPALRREVAPDGSLTGAPAEVIAADAREHVDGRATAFVRLLAGLLGVGFDDLRQRELQRRNRRLTFITAASLVGMVLTFGLALVAWRARNDAERRQDQAEDVLAFMLGDFREDLKKVGQLALLEKVGTKAMAYFDTADPRDLTDSALTRQAKALTQIGEVRLDQKDVRFDEAERVFLAAHVRTAELVARHPRDGEMLFERAQAEFWIGNTHLKRGDFEQAALWFTRYRDSGAALVALDPVNVKWQHELISGYHNLAVLDVRRGHLSAARAGFLAEIEALKPLVARDLKNAQLRYNLADADSFLGTIASRTGDYAEALARFASQRSYLEALVRQAPGSAEYVFKLADCSIWEARVLAATGKIDTANEGLARAEGLLVPLLKRDPANRRWAGVMAAVQSRQGEFAARSEPARSMRLVTEASAKVEHLLAAEPGDRVNLQRMLVSLRIEAQLRFEAGEITMAVPQAARAVEIADVLVREAKTTTAILGEVANVYIVAGRLASADGRPEQAIKFWRRGATLLAPRIVDSREWGLLDPAARIFSLLGQRAEARRLIELLQSLGYVPLEPWP